MKSICGQVAMSQLQWIVLAFHRNAVLAILRLCFQCMRQNPQQIPKSNCRNGVLQLQFGKTSLHYTFCETVTRSIGQPDTALFVLQDASYQNDVAEVTLRVLCL